MFIICDSNNIIQDIATEQANLSRGLKIVGHKIYETQGDIRIGDSFDGSLVVPNDLERSKIAQCAAAEVLIEAKKRELAITALKAEGKLPGDFV
jgi:hypothetical protein